MKSAFTILLIFSIFSIPKISFSQIKEFHDPVTFPTELTEYMNRTTVTGVAENVKKFVEYWQMDFISEGQKLGIMLTFNMLSRKRCKVYPDFNDYLRTINAFYEVGRFEDYIEWEVGLVNLVDIKNATAAEIGKFLNFSADLMCLNILNKTSSSKWVSSNNDFKINNNPDNGDIYIEFRKIDLTCKTAKDSSVSIFDTHGTFYPYKQIWIGKEGKVTWERAGFPASKVFAELKNYRIELDKTYYSADSVTFTNYNYFDYNLIGKLEDKVVVISSEENATYPKFFSYDKKVVIKDVVDGIDYIGGFSMQGAKFIGQQTSTETVSITMNRNNKEFFTADALIFEFQKKNIYADNASVRINLDKNSTITHPGLAFRYIIPENRLLLTRYAKGRSISPYFDSYHNIDIDCFQLSWKINDSLMLFQTNPGAPNTFAKFDSREYFSPEFYEQLQGQDRTHPLVTLYQFMNDTSISRTFILPTKFTVSEYAKYINKVNKTIYSEEQVSLLLLTLSYSGFVLYDSENKIVEIQQRTMDYIASYRNYRDAKSEKKSDYSKSSLGVKDYDAISIVSTLPQTYGINAKLNLNNLEIEIYQPQRIAISTSRNVYLRPDSIVTIRKNRNIVFNGRILAGNAIFQGKQFNFDYSKFSIAMPKIEMLRFLIHHEAKSGAYDYPIYSLIENAKGILLVDDSTTKSGITRNSKIINTAYPKFKTLDTSYVYYDYPTKGKYPRTDFYFANYPFSFDSLNYLTKEKLKLRGTFKSGIFPDFEETLTLQEDTSLGFIRPAGENGLDVFGGKGRFFNNIKLDNSGLGGQGIIKYLTTSIYSNNFLFYPDSMNAIAQKFIIDKLTKDSIKYVKGAFEEYADLKADSVFVHWYPEGDQLISKNLDKPFFVYNNIGNLRGQINLTNQGLTASGIMGFVDAQMKSKNFKYKASVFNSDTLNFALNDIEGKSIPLKSDNLNAQVDVEKSYGIFITNSDTCTINFPANKYLSYIDHFIWNIQQRTVDIGGGLPNSDEKLLVNSKHQKDSLLSIVNSDDKKNIRLKGSRFVSYEPKQDSLNFYSGSSSYDLTEKLIIAKEVEKIYVADAIIYPSNAVYIEKDAKMRPLAESKIITDTANLNHTINRALVYIQSRKNFKAKGEYQYIDYNKNSNIIKLDTILVDTAFHTYAKGKIAETDSFFLSPEFKFFGDFNLHSSRKFLNFKGAAQIVHNCPKIPRYFIKFESEINPDTIFIPLNEDLRDVINRKMVSGMFLTKDSMIYNFLSKKDIRPHDTVLLAGGFLNFDKKSNYFKISSKEKIDSMELPDNYISLHKNFCFMYGEGKMNMGVKLGQVKLQVSGNMFNKVEERVTTFNIMMGVNFHFLAKNLNQIADEIIEDKTLKPIDPSSKTYQKNLIILVGMQQAQDLFNQISLTGEYKTIPPEFNHTIMFTDIKLLWDSVSRSYKSIGQLGIGNMKNRQINKYVNGNLEIVKKQTGDIFNLYLLIGSKWYFFSYSNGVMISYSSDNDYNNNLMKLKDKERKLKVAKYEMTYEYIIGSEKNKKKFLDNLQDGQTQITDINILDNQDIGDDSENIFKIQKDTTIISTDSLFQKDLDLFNMDSLKINKNQTDTTKVIPDLNQKNDSIQQNIIVPDFNNDQNNNTQDTIKQKINHNPDIEENKTNETDNSYKNDTP